MSTALAGPGTTPLFGHARQVAPDERTSSTDIWISDASAHLAEISSFSDDTSVFRVTERIVRNSGRVKVTRAANSDFYLVHVGHGSAAPADEMDAVAAIATLKVRLGVSERVIQKAAGIRHRTHQHWKQNREAKPRAGSLGQLWSLLRAVDELETYLGDGRSLARWLKERPERTQALEAGQFSRLVDSVTQTLRSDPASVTVVEFDELAPDVPLAAGNTVRDPKGQSWSLDAEIPRIVLD